MIYRRRENELCSYGLNLFHDGAWVLIIPLWFVPRTVRCFTRYIEGGDGILNLSILYEIRDKTFNINFSALYAKTQITSFGREPKSLLMRRRGEILEPEGKG